jgi:deaminated glutathione amidase
MNGRETYGHSMIVDPWGVVLDCLPTGTGHVMADIDLAKLRATRERFPALKHRRFGLAGQLQK